MLLCFLWCLNVVMDMWRSSRQSLHFSARVKQTRGKWELQSLQGQTCLYRSSRVAEQNHACLWWMHTKSGDDAPRRRTGPLNRPSCGHVDVFSCLHLWKDIWVQTELTWAAQALCHEHCAHWIDALQVGRCFVFARVFPTWQPGFKRSYFTATQCTEKMFLKTF